MWIKIDVGSGSGDKELKRNDFSLQIHYPTARAGRRLPLAKATKQRGGTPRRTRRRRRRRQQRGGICSRRRSHHSREEQQQQQQQPRSQRGGFLPGRSSSSSSSSLSLFSLSLGAFQSRRPLKSFRGAATMSKGMQPRNKGVHWSDSEVKAFLKIWSEDDIRRDLDESVRNKQVFQRIATKMAVKGFYRDWNQCRIKMKNMKREFKLALKQPSSHRGTVLRGRKFFDDLCQLLLGPPPSPPHFTTSSDSPAASPPPEFDMATLNRIKREEPDDAIEEEEEEDEEEDGVMLINSPSSTPPPPFYLNSVLPIITSTCSIRPSNTNNTTVSSTTCPATMTSAANATTTTVVTISSGDGNGDSNENGRSCSNNNDDDNSNNNDSSSSINSGGGGGGNSNCSDSNIDDSGETRVVEAEQSEPLPLTFSSDLRSSSNGSLVVHSSTDLLPVPSPEDDGESGVLQQVVPPSSDISESLLGALGRLADVLVQMTEAHAHLERESRALDRMERRRENRLRRKHEERLRTQEREHQMRMMRLLMAVGIANPTTTTVSSPL